MSGRVPGDPALDDWFDEPQPRPDRRTGTTAPADDWLDDGQPGGRLRATALAERVRIPSGGRGLLVAAGLFVVILLIALAAAGVFSGGGSTTATSTPPATTTTASTPPPANTPATAPTAPATTLKPGAKGREVRKLQKALASLGYSPGKADGSYGPATQHALERFQRAQKLSPDGVLGPKTLAALRSALGASG